MSSEHITTFRKIHFKPLEPDMEQINIEDIAHALSLMTRANGHFPEFYSVGQHCNACYEEAKARGYSAKVALACLLHDASEAYLADITRPVKKALSEYLVIEKKLQDSIYERFLSVPLTEEECRQIAEVDDSLLFYEFDYFMGEKLLSYVPRLFSKPVFATEPFKQTEMEYLSDFREGSRNYDVERTGN